MISTSEIPPKNSIDFNFKDGFVIR